MLRELLFAGSCVAPVCGQKPRTPTRPAERESQGYRGGFFPKRRPGTCSKSASAVVRRMPSCRMYKLELSAWKGNFQASCWRIVNKYSKQPAVSSASCASSVAADHMQLCLFTDSRLQGRRPREGMASSIARTTSQKPHMAIPFQFQLNSQSQITARNPDFMKGTRSSENTPKAYCFWPTDVELKNKRYVEQTAKRIAAKLWYPKGSQAFCQKSSGK